MSTPQGHPDYQDYAIWRGPLTVDGFQTVSVGAGYTLTPNLNCTNFASVLLCITGITGAGITVAAGFAGGAVNTPSNFWTLLPGQQLYVLLPAATNRFFLSITTAQAGTQHFNLLVAPTNTPATRITYLNQNNSMHDVSRTLAAGAAMSYVLPYVQEGEIEAMLQPQDTSGKLEMAVTGLGENGLAAYAANLQFAGLVPFQTQAQRVLVGPDPVLIVVQNDDVANPHTYSMTARMVAAAHG